MTTRDAKTLYQELVLDHGKSPRNEGPLDGETHTATARNPLCGDRVTVHARVDEGACNKGPSGCRDPPEWLPLAPKLAPRHKNAH